jgi:hypothetical protein
MVCPTFQSFDFYGRIVRQHFGTQTPQTGKSAIASQKIRLFDWPSDPDVGIIPKQPALICRVVFTADFVVNIRGVA